MYVGVEQPYKEEVCARVCAFVYTRGVLMLGRIEQLKVKRKLRLGIP